MKKLFSLLTCFALIATLAACGGAESKPETTTPPEASKPATSEPAEATGEQPKGFPSKNIEIIAPAGAGSAADQFARGIEAAADLGGTAVVLNLAGGSATIGITEALTRPADGHTILIAPIAGLIMQPFLTEVPYTMDDFRILTACGPLAFNGIYVSADSDIQNVDDLIAAMKAGDLSYASPNVGSIGQMAAQEWFNQVGVSAEHVAFSGNNEVATALMGNHIDFACLSNSSMKQYEESGQVRAIMSLSGDPVPNYPDMPSAGELGYEGFDRFSQQTFFLIRKDTPADVAEFLKQQIFEGVRSESYQALLETTGAAYDYSEPYTEEYITGLLKETSDMYAEILSDYT